MNRRNVFPSLALIGAGLVLPARAQTPVATPDTRSLDPEMQYEGSQSDFYGEPWKLGDHWVEIGVTGLQRFVGTTDNEFEFHKGDLQVGFRSIVAAEGPGWNVIIGTHTDLSEIDGVYTAIARGYYAGDGLLEAAEFILPTRILDAVELFSNETPKPRG